MNMMSVSASPRRPRRRASLTRALRNYLVLLCGMLAVCDTAALAAAEPASTGGQALIRRLTPGQYANSIKDIFGEGIVLGGRFEPDVRVNGLLAVGTSRVSVTAAGFEQYYTTARAVADQVTDKAHRATLIPCEPANEKAADDVCARQFLEHTGRLLFRRPLTQGELETQVSVAREAGASLKDFYAGVRVSLTNLLVSPMFLFRQETLAIDPAHPDQAKLDAFSMATRLSFLLWDTAPDEALLHAAENGELNTEKGLARQVNRLLNSPRLELGVRALFTDMLGFDEFATLTKDTVIFPKFTNVLIGQAQEQTLRTLVSLLLTERGDYRDIFTTRKTFLTPSLGILYAVPVVLDRPINTPERWVAVEYPEGDPRTGLLTHASFVALHSHPGRSSPTLRGKALREIFLCQKVPQPPGNVSFEDLQDTANPVHRTVRARVNAHLTNPVCAGCHKITDPIGLALENFDSAGGFRTAENGVEIDTSGELTGVKFVGAAGLGQTMHDSAAATSCFVNRAFSYATGLAPALTQANYLKFAEDRFAAKGYRLPDFLKEIAMSKAFYQIDAPRTAKSGETKADATTGPNDIPARVFTAQKN